VLQDIIGDGIVDDPTVEDNTCTIELPKNTR